MLNNLPKLYRKDPWINAIYDSVAEQFELFNKLNKSNLDNINFNTLDERGCEIYEKDLQLSRRETLEERRRVIKEKWNANYDVSVPSLQVTANQYFNGMLNVSYEGKANLIFTTLVGLNYFETDFSEFEKVIELIKPAHFTYEYRHKSNLWIDYYNPVVWRNGLKWTWRGQSNAKWSEVTGDYGKTTWGYCITRSWSGHLTERIEYNGN